jgi:diguanylate cyclase (GGDEF)-like protein/PAS domain S-box-containing protein
MTDSNHDNGGPLPLAEAIASASFEHALDAMLLADDGRRYTDANPAACSLLGLPREEVVSRRLDDFVTEEMRPPLDGAWRDFLESGTQSGEFELVIADGSRRMVEFRATANVLPGHHLSVLRDISSRAAGEEAKRTKEAYDFLSGVLQHVDVGLYVVDDERRMSFVNPAAAAMLGYGSPNELVGLPAHETIHYKHPDRSAFPAEECPHLAVFDTGQAIGGEDWFVRKDGSMIPVAHSSAPIPLPGGRGAVVAFRDISERRRAELDREREREFLDAVLESLDAGVVACGPDGALSLFNRATREMHGMPAEALSPEDWAGRYRLFRPDGRTPMEAEDVPLLRALRGEHVREAELVIAPQDQPPRIVLCNGRAFESKDGRSLGAVVAMHDVTERRRAQEQLAHQALHDPLTGLPNRALLRDRVEQALERSKRDSSTVGVLFLDLDDFELISHSRGHVTGERLLVQVAARLEDTLRSTDTAARLADETLTHFGGDQFVILCEGLQSERDAIRVAERIRAALAPPFALEGTELRATASIGIALAKPGESTRDGVISDADAAMRRAKERGRDRYELFDEEVRTRVRDRLQLERELREAIGRDELRLFYQPIVSVTDGALVGVEALIRWQHPRRGLLLPAEFIPLAEESGLIVPLGRWVLEEACRQSVRWHESSPEWPPPRVSVNLSARQITDELPAIVTDAFKLTGAHASRLTLELTETLLMEGAQSATDVLAALRELGVRIALDDFGTGYSSLSYLQRFPLDVLKLDRSFVSELGITPSASQIVAATIDMARAFGMSVVAEGVESEDQLQRLQDLGCHFAQGYYFARPQPPEAIAALLEEFAETGNRAPLQAPTVPDGP